MYKLKVTSQHSICVTTYYFDTMQEVANKIASICNAKTMAEIMAAKREHNWRFYLSQTKRTK